MPFLRQSTTQVILFGPCLDKGDGVTEETGLTLAQADMRLSKDGGAFAQKSAAGNASHDSDGWYNTTLSTTDTATVGELVLNVHQPANMLPVWLRYWVLEENVYDSWFGASAAAGTELAAIPTTAMRGTDGVVLSGPTKAEMDTAHGLLATPAQVNTQVGNALDTAIPGSPTGGSINEAVKRLARSVGVVQEYTIDNTSFTATTTEAQVDAVDIGSLEATDNHFIGRIIIFTSGVNIHQATDITDYDGTNKRFTYTALTDIPEDDATFIVV